MSLGKDFFKAGLLQRLIILQCLFKKPQGHCHTSLIRKVRVKLLIIEQLRGKKAIDCKDQLTIPFIIY